MLCEAGTDDKRLIHDLAQRYQATIEQALLIRSLEGARDHSVIRNQLLTSI